MPDDKSPNLGTSAFRDLVGYRLVEWDEDTATVAVDIDRRHMNRKSILHGGVVATVVDAAGGYAGTHCTVPGNVRRCVTVSITVNFLGQVRGGRLIARAAKRGGGRRIFVATVEVTNEGGDLVATGEAVYRYVRGSESPEGVPPAAD